jgi:hypothetical protein
MGIRGANILQVPPSLPFLNIEREKSEADNVGGEAEKGGKDMYGRFVPVSV